jgi:SAM-dependent methyltransferase
MTADRSGPGAHDGGDPMTSPPSSGATSRLKHGVRALADRAAIPYVNALTNRLGQRIAAEVEPVRQLAAASLAATQEAGARPSGAPDVMDRLLPPYYPLLHELRSAELAAMPGPVSTILSAGCNGRWYFEWFDDCYGVVDRHIGIERYVPPPDDLPSNVEWIDDDTADMSRVESGSVDLVFSGQNIEHLWPEQVAGFLLEAHRVLRPGGWIVLDSPNRIITEALNWSHPEHIVEFSVDEADRILTAAGFEQESMRGIWLNRVGSRILPLMPLDPEGLPTSLGILRRIVLAARRPEDSFVWWAEYRKAGDPDPEALRALLEEIHAAAWPRRVDRLVAHSAVVEDGDGRWARAEPGTGALLYDGPYLPLQPGEHLVRLTFRSNVGADEPVAEVDVTWDHNRKLVLARQDVVVPQGGGTTVVEVPLRLDDVTFGVQFRARSTGVAQVDGLLHVDLRSQG